MSLGNIMTNRFIYTFKNTRSSQFILYREDSEFLFMLALVFWTIFGGVQGLFLSVLSKITLEELLKFLGAGH